MGLRVEEAGPNSSMLTLYCNWDSATRPRAAPPPKILAFEVEGLDDALALTPPPLVIVPTANSAACGCWRLFYFLVVCTPQDTHRVHALLSQNLRTTAEEDTRLHDKALEPGKC